VEQEAASARPCPLCAAPSLRRFQAHGHWIRDCTRCRHRFAEIEPAPDHVARVYGDDYFQAGGAGYAGYLDEGRLLRERGRWYGRLLARSLANGTVLDVGSAAGFWLAGLADCGFTVRGIEPNATMAAHARERLGLAVETAELERFATAERFDLVSLVQVVAHLRDVRGALERAVALVRPGGHLLVESWDRDSRTARWFGESWHEYSPPSVLHWFSAAGLRDLGTALGLREIARGRPRRRIGVAHVRSLLRHTGERSALARTLARVLGAVPGRLSLPYPGDDLFWMLLRR
jgi:SAM-dependent methyltransferase